MPKILPEVFVSNAETASQVYKELKKGRIRKLGSMVYTSNLQEPEQQIVKRHLWLFEKAHTMLKNTNAFEDARDAEYRGIRLKLPALRF